MAPEQKRRGVVDKPGSGETNIRQAQQQEYDLQDGYTSRERSAGWQPQKMGSYM